MYTYYSVVEYEDRQEDRRRLVPVMQPVPFSVRDSSIFNEVREAYWKLCTAISAHRRREALSASAGRRRTDRRGPLGPQTDSRGSAAKAGPRRTAADERSGGRGKGFRAPGRQQRHRARSATATDGRFAVLINCVERLARGGSSWAGSAAAGSVGSVSLGVLHLRGAGWCWVRLVRADGQSGGRAEGGRRPWRRRRTAPMCGR